MLQIMKRYPFGLFLSKYAHNPYFCHSQASRMDYNTTRPHLAMKEYGRHVQKMVDHILSIEDKERRQKNAQSVIELMGFFNPHLKSVEDYRHKLWDHLFLIADFNLEVDSPYPIPTRESLKAKPAPLPYPKRYPRYSHLGKHLELVIAKAMTGTIRIHQYSICKSVQRARRSIYETWRQRRGIPTAQPQRRWRR